MHSSTISTLVELVEKKVEGPLSEKQLANIIGESLEFFDDAVVREHIYRLNIKKVQLKEEIAKLEAIKTKLDLQAARRNKAIFSLASMFFTAQFGISYYCIYEVDWLGWDLVEPMTYTIGQGLFVSGLLYSLRNMGQNTNFSSIDQYYKNKRLEKWFLKHGVEPDRLNFLQEELAKVEAELNAAEQQRYA